MDVVVSEKQNFDSIKSYLHETAEIVSEVQFGNTVSEFLADLKNLAREAKLLDDQIKIIHAQETGNAETLHLDYNAEELIELHGISNDIQFEDYLLVKDLDGVFKIYENEELKSMFYLCEHRVYSPVESLEKISTDQCLQCV